MYVYVASFATQADLDELHDEPYSIREWNLEHLASPGLAGVEVHAFGNIPPSANWIETMRDLVTNDLDDHYEDEEFGHISYELTWETGDWNHPDVGRPNRTDRLFVQFGDRKEPELAAMLVIQQVEG